MNITIIGAGNVGSTLAQQWQKLGHHISLGVRNPSKYKELEMNETGKIGVYQIDDAMEKGEVIILAIPGTSVEQFLQSHNLEDKIVIDATNNIGNPTRGIAYLAQQFPEVKFIKAFNTIGYNIMEDPLFGSIRADGYFAGDDEEGLKLVEQLIADLGFDPIHVGAVQMATNLEALAWLWITQSRTRGREIAFKLLSR